VVEKVSLKRELKTFWKNAGESWSTAKSLVRRQERLLRWLLGFCLVFCAVMLVVLLIVKPHADLVLRKYEVMICCLLVFLFIELLLSGKKTYLLSAWLFILVSGAVPWLCILIDPSILQGNVTPLTYVIFSVLLSSIFLPAFITSSLAYLQTAGLVWLFIKNPSDATNWVSMLGFVLLTSLFGILASYIIQGDMEKITDQNRKLENSEQRLREQAIRDFLTHLFNRRYLEETLDREIQRARRKVSMVGLIIMDVDNLKSLNDTLGHSAGDTALRELGTYLAHQLRKYDIACRYGGDEFVLVLPDASRQSISRRAEQLRSGLNTLKTPERISVSVGTAVFPENGQDRETLLRAADAALYRAKALGGNHVVAADLEPRKEEV
jgi:diguanylate cyclase (GGDEF)-like protein